MGVQKPVLFFRSYLNKGLYCGVNNIYSINKTLIKNDINTITINSDIENKIRHPILALLNSSPTKMHKLEAPLIFKQSRSQLSNQDLVKRSNLIKIFKLNKLYKVLNNISNSDFLGEMDLRALNYLILSYL